ncbi:iron transporter [Pseudomonas sp. PDM16]|uniref:iron transporter n=1 Tax=Pseudomonas sp. PDM16 TaxID=2769292 RepID=UPI00177D2FDA|nr:iron transporter [Pseudomonas sp. PDM16]MBD9414276.1 iron transporter [Pseudomonas sp. PDM16]
MKSSHFAWPVLSRTLAAILGGYAFTYAFTAALARLLPLTPSDALVVATLPAFVIYPLAILWAFACDSAARAWYGVALAVPLALVGFWPQLSRALT